MHTEHSQLTRQQNLSRQEFTVCMKSNSINGQSRTVGEEEDNVMNKLIGS
jgi:hypothetical protein